MTGFSNMQDNANAAMPVWLASPTWAGASWQNIATNGPILIKSGAGVFLGLSVNAGGSGSTATVYDGVDDGGKLVGTYATTVQGGPTLPAAGLALATGLFVVTSGSEPANITIAYQ